MQTKMSTRVAVLRTQLGLTVEQFANVIGKSTSTINSLETGRLALSQETAYRIEEMTGVSMQWVLGEGSTEKPFWINQESQRLKWEKSYFELIQTRNVASGLRPAKPAWRLANGITVGGDWLSIYSAADQHGQGSRAIYLMTRFLEDLTKRLGKDDETFL